MTLLRRVALELSLALGVCLTWLAPLGAQESATDLGAFAPPETPAAALLGMDANLVQRPGIVSDFVASLNSATNSFSVIPENFAMAISPYWLSGKGEGVEFDEYIKNGDVKTNIAQSFMLSLAATGESDAVTDSAGAAVAIGFRFSFARGNVQDTAVVELAERLALTTAEVEAAIEAAILADTIYGRLDSAHRASQDRAESAILDAQLTERRAEIVAAEQARINELRTSVQDLWASRTGWVADLAGGIVLDFPSRRWAGGRVSQWGGWFTWGYEGPKLSLLAVQRFLANDAPRLEPNAIDNGVRLSIIGSERFSLSGEVALRSYLGGETKEFVADDGETMELPVYENEWRGVLNVEFAVSQNRTLALSFGQDFNGNVNGNDLIAMVRFLVGIGTSRVPES